VDPGFKLFFASKLMVAGAWAMDVFVEAKMLMTLGLIVSQWVSWAPQGAVLLK
jgi:hypothetical protein